MIGRKSKVLGGALLVSGTTIGAAVLALPVSTGGLGFYPSLMVFIFAWVYLLFTAFLMLELTLAMPEDSNIITMARKTLGRGGKIVAWGIYLFLLYSLTTAYIAGSGPMMRQAGQMFLSLEISPWVASIPFVLFFGAFVYKGTASVDILNRSLMFGLAIAYLAVLFLTYPKMDLELLDHKDWTLLPVAVSVTVTSFGFHIIIPSLATYMKRDVKRLRRSILLGAFLPLVLYIFWEMMALSVIPLEGEFGLRRAWTEGLAATQVLDGAIQAPGIVLAARLFELFAIVTSFLGVSLSLRDCLADGLRIKKTSLGRGLLCLLAFVPPLFITATYGRAFLSGLEVAGIYGVVMLLAFFPALMTWQVRYVLKLETPYRTPGGALPVLAVMGVSLCLVTLELLRGTGIL